MRLMLTLLLAAVPAFAAKTPKASSDAPSFKKVIIVVFENADPAEALAQPFFSQLAQKGARLSEYYAVGHPSQPNYIALVGGDTLGVDSDRTVTLEDTNLADLMEAAGKTWKLYAEDFPGDCSLRSTSGAYARKHAPLLSFKNVQDDPKRCARVVEGSAFFSDFAAGALPDYSLFVPNLDDDGHDTGVDAADQWFSRKFGPLLDDPKFGKDTLLVATFDEDDGAGDNRVLTLLYGPGVTPGYVSGNRYDHYSLLRTVEDALGLGTLGRQDASAAPIAGVWKRP